MAHQIEATDSLLLYKNPAWHGLGTIVEEEYTATEALDKIDMDWNVLQKPVLTEDLDGNIIEVPEWRFNVREDTGKRLGLVSKSYQNVQNRELAKFTDSLVENGDKIVLESAGSIRGGARVWFLVRGESFSIRRDEVTPYLCVTSGFDGFTPVQGIPTFIRPVCANTLNMVLRSSHTSFGKNKKAMFKLKHTSSVLHHIKEAQELLGLYGKAQADTKEVIEYLDSKNFDTETARKFFFTQYTKDVEAIPNEPKTRAENNAVDRAQIAWQHLEQRLDLEKDLTGGSSMWALLQAYTGWYQNDKKTTIKDPVERFQRAQESKLFGAGSQSALDAMSLALSI